jgi:hypothetical protein
LFHRNQGTQPTDLFIPRLLQSLAETPQPRQGLPQQGLRHHLGQFLLKPIQMTQGAIIAEQAPNFAPLRATELLARLVQLRLRLTPAQQMAIRVKA